MDMLEHLKSRHLDTDLHKVWYDDVERVASFPLWNLSGQLCGYQAYRPDAAKVQKNDLKGRYYTFRGEKLLSKHCKTVTVWGLESWYLTNTLFVTEGVFDAARLTEKGYSAVATMTGTPDTSTKLWFKMVREQRPVVSVCDYGVEKLKRLSHQNVTAPVEFDLGDAPEDYVNDLLKEYGNG